MGRAEQSQNINQCGCRLPAGLRPEVRAARIGKWKWKWRDMQGTEGDKGERVLQERTSCVMTRARLDLAGDAGVGCGVEFLGWLGGTGVGWGLAWWWWWWCVSPHGIREW
jgi:hypothetical protein